MPGHVGVRTVLLGGLPLLVAAVPQGPEGARFVAAVSERGLAELPGLTGVELPRGARLGFSIDQRELRLVDEQDTALLRAPREGLDDGWLEAAKRLRGTMTIVAVDLELDADLAVPAIVARVDAAGAAGGVRGAIVGLVEERPTLPLFF